MEANILRKDFPVSWQFLQDENKGENIFQRKTSKPNVLSFQILDHAIVLTHSHHGCVPKQQQHQKKTRKRKVRILTG